MIARTSGTDGNGGQIGSRRLHSSGLGPHCRWSLRPNRHQECAAVDLWHVLTRVVGREGWGTVHELACFLSPLVVDVVLPVLMQQQASAVLVSLQWRCHRFSSSMSWGFSLGLVGVHCQVVDVPVVRQRQVPTAFRVPLRVWKRSAYFLRAVSRYSHLDPGHYSIELLVSGMHSATGFSRQSMVAFGRISGKIYVVSAPNQSAHGNLDATSTSLVGWSHIPVQFPEAFGRMSDFFCVLGLLGSCDRSTSCSPWCSLSRG